METSSTMMAVVFDGSYKVSLQQRPIPQIQDDDDIIVKVQATALCGSELHVFRGHQMSDTGFIMGHEFAGVVVEIGKAVKSVKVGDRIVSPFTISCNRCFYCMSGFTSRCEKSLLFGHPKLDGAQAEYVRVPLADGTVMRAPSEIEDEALVLMADIFPTGYFGATNAFKSLSRQDPSEVVAVVIGCGPVGLCSIVSSLEYTPKHLFAIDSVDSRLDLAYSLGAEPLNFQTDPEGMRARILEATSGRGADVVIEAVGLSPALRTAFDLVRPFGFISSIGVHNGEIPWTATEAYSKNLTIQMGRCPVRAIFADALQLLAKKQHLLRGLLDKQMPLTDAIEGYELFNAMKSQKIIFKL